MQKEINKTLHVSPEIESLVPYTPGKAIAEVQRELGLEKIIKLASNENPLGASPKALASIHAHLSSIYRYPEASSYDLIAALAAHLSVPKETIALGNGSNELIDLIIRIFCEPGTRMVTSEKAFVAYSICAQASRVKTVEVPCTSDLQTDIDRFILYFEKFSDERDRVVFIANPNNPTGHYINAQNMERLLTTIFRDPRRIVVMDEAYFEYVRAKDYSSGLRLMKQFPNLIVLRTFSKVYGLAGLRVGYMVARPEIVSYVNRVRNPFNINSLAQAACAAALHDQEHVHKSVQLVWTELDRIHKELAVINIPYLPSQGNFLTIKTPEPGSKWQDQLTTRGILLRPLQPYSMLNYLRWTIGLPDENDAVLEALGILKGELI